ncbi:MAG: N-acetyltransferase [Sphingomonadaceae bacterium]|nr:N-acetyltransferase [Sphingomonadaceae bacterium]
MTGDVTARIGDGVSGLDAAQWDACAGTRDPFVGHAFLSALEASGSVGPGTGWQAIPIAIGGADGNLSGVVPAYAKSHSQGEYIFDHNWAEAWEHAGGHYYPKLLIAVPFTPAPGPRLLTGDPHIARALIAAAEAVVAQHRLSTAHANFVEEGQLRHFRDAGWLIREGSQFHWTNHGYRDFDDFLDALSSRKRKAIRRERAAAIEGVDIVRLTGAAIGEAHWDAFWEFYQDTGSRKWGRPYLTRPFFSLLGEAMAERVLLVLALKDSRPIAGALNMIGEDALYGRYWGCTEEAPFLHFELCYYQAIDFAIERGLSRVEAGAQGEHKLARGYLPVPTWSAHHIPDPGFRPAISDFLVRERRAVENNIAFMEALGPFRRA